MFASAFLLFASQAVSPAQALLDGIRDALAAGDQATVVSYFKDPRDADYLVSMAHARGGLKNLQICMFAPPPGWDNGTYWAEFHTFQDVEEDHDALFRVIANGDDVKLGSEIPESEFGPMQVSRSRVGVTITPETKTATVTAILDLAGTMNGKAPVFRLNDVYRMTSAKIGLSGHSSPLLTATDKEVVYPKIGNVLRAGGLLIPWESKQFNRARFEYFGVLDRKGEDHINDHLAYITAWWIPSLGRLPFRSGVQVTAPKGWIMRSEGSYVARPNGSPTRFTGWYFPISFPKVVAGKYVLAASIQDNGRTFRSYQFAPIDKARATADVQRMAEAAKFYDRTFIRYPAYTVDVLDAEDYYGIEGYQYALLAPSITTRYVAHEMAHTYFGGIVPCSYTVDSWDEGVTTYVDDVLTGRNVDRPLEGAIETIDVHTPLNQMPAAHDFNGASYWRGAYVMKMLESEIGQDAVLEGLRELIATRRSLPTTWDNLLEVFEDVAGTDLDWFWQQWIDSADFPELKLISATTVKKKGYETTLTYTSSLPYRLRLTARVTDGEHIKALPFTSDAQRGQVVITTDFPTSEAEIQFMGTALVHDKGTRVVVTSQASK